MNNRNVKLESTTVFQSFSLCGIKCPLVSTMTIDTRASHFCLHLNLTSPCLLICSVDWQKLLYEQSTERGELKIPRVNSYISILCSPPCSQYNNNNVCVWTSHTAIFEVCSIFLSHTWQQMIKSSVQDLNQIYGLPVWLK